MTAIYANAPLFVGLVGGNPRLQSNSLCIKARNKALVTTATDLDGRPRIVGGTRWRQHNLTEGTSSLAYEKR